MSWKQRTFGCAWASLVSCVLFLVSQTLSDYLGYFAWRVVAVLAILFLVFSLIYATYCAGQALAHRD